MAKRRTTRERQRITAPIVAPVSLTRTEALIQAHTDLQRAAVEAAIAPITDPAELRATLRQFTVRYRKEGATWKDVSAYLGISPALARQLLLEAHAAGEYDETELIIQNELGPAAAKRMHRELKSPKGKWQAARDTLKGTGKFRQYREVHEQSEQKHAHLHVLIESPPDGQRAITADAANIIGQPRLPAETVDAEKVR